MAGVDTRTRTEQETAESSEGEGLPEAPSSYRSWTSTALVVAIYIGLAVVCYWGAWSTDPARNSLVGGDQFQVTWYLGWTPFAILHGHNPFFSDYLNYPYGLNTLTNTGIVLLGLLAAPVTLLFGATAAYNTMMTLALATSATTS